MAPRTFQGLSLDIFHIVCCLVFVWHGTAIFTHILCVNHGFKKYWKRRESGQQNKLQSSSCILPLRQRYDLRPWKGFQSLLNIELIDHKIVCQYLFFVLLHQQHAVVLFWHMRLIAGNKTRKYALMKKCALYKKGALNNPSLRYFDLGVYILPGQPRSTCNA